VISPCPNNCGHFQIQTGNELEAALTLVTKLRLQDLPDEEGSKRLLAQIGKVDLIILKFTLLLDALQAKQVGVKT
jgi:hypothetical protein